MAHYSIYIPQATAPRSDLLDEVGLEGLVRPDDLGPSFFQVLQQGPDGGSGFILTWVDPSRPDANPKLGYFPDLQRWEKAPPDPERQLPEGRYWFGIETARPPKPEDLARNVTLPGFLVTLADGNDWRLPKAGLLPHRIGIGPDGRETQVVKDQFRRIADRMQWSFEDAAAAIRGEKLRKPREYRQYVAEMICENYRVNLPLCYWLLLFDESNWWSVANSTVDWQRLIEIEEDLKKNEPASPPNT